MLIIEKNINKGISYWESSRNNLRIAQGLIPAQPIPKLHLWALALWKNDNEYTATIAIYRNPNMGGHIYTIGGFEANIKTTSGLDILIHVEKHLRATGAKKIIGPMLGSTWHSYGYNLNDQTIFSDESFLPEYIDYWKKAGFVKDRDFYHYQISPMPTYDIKQKMKALKQLGVAIRYKDQFDSKLLATKLFDFLHLSFRKAYLFTALGKHEFVKKYLPFCQHSNDSIFWIATAKERIIAIAFGFKNELRKNSYVLKTLARDPVFPVKAIGLLMAFHFSNECKKLGAKEIIFANMREDNFSLLLAKEQGAKQLNTITLFKK